MTSGVRDPKRLDRLLVLAPEYDADFEVNGNCPVQAFGTVLGRDLYFRARFQEWSFEVANSDGHLPSDGYPNGFYREGKHPNAGWMSPECAVKIIEECLREFTHCGA